MTFTTLLEDNLAGVTKSLSKDLAIPYLRIYPEKIIRNVDGGKLKSELVKFQKLDPFARETKLKWQRVKKHLFRNKQDGDD